MPLKAVIFDMDGLTFDTERISRAARFAGVTDQICPDAELEAAAFAVVPRLDALVDIIRPLV
jgi:beta-phosphoglucomutase-like phosphatase (HAD superfamily)